MRSFTGNIMSLVWDTLRLLAKMVIIISLHVSTLLCSETLQQLPLRNGIFSSSLLPSLEFELAITLALAHVMPRKF